MNNPDHHMDMVVFGYCISKYLLTIPQEEALQKISTGYSKEALEILYNTAMEQEDYEVCIIVEKALRHLF